MRDIRASVEVKELVGLETLRELEGDAFEHYDCWRCGGQAVRPIRQRWWSSVTNPRGSSSLRTLDARNRRLWTCLLIDRQTWKHSD
jgi:hypothetical protein